METDEGILLTLPSKINLALVKLNYIFARLMRNFILLYYIQLRTCRLYFPVRQNYTMFRIQTEYVKQNVLTLDSLGLICYMRNTHYDILLQSKHQHKKVSIKNIP